MNTVSVNQLNLFALKPTTYIIFSHLAELARKSDGHAKVDRDKGFIPVVVEIIEAGELTEKVSIAHYYEQNGDLMADPEMCFYHLRDQAICIPYYFKNDGMACEKESVSFNGSREPEAVDTNSQAEQTNFAEMWMRNIKHQQELKLK